MNENQDRFHIRKHPRMAHYDYATPNYYFITICAKNKKCIFGTLYQKNAYGDIAEKGLLEIPRHFEKVCIDKYIVMPNHIHAIIALENGAKELPTIVGQYKAYVSRKIHAIASTKEVWQSSFHDHVIRNQSDYERIWNYIDGNQKKWQEDCYFVEE